MKKIFAIIGLLPLFTGCFFTTPDSRFYMLENTKNPAVVSDKKINIAVQDVNFPQYLDRPQIVLQQPDNPEIKIAEFDRWAADFGTMLQNRLIDNLQSALPNADIKPLAFGNKPKFIVKLTIEKFGGWLNENAYLQGNWQIVNTRGKLLTEQNFNLSDKVGKNYGSYVQAQSRLLAQVADDIAKRIGKLH